MIATISLIIFFLVIVASLRGWIKQSILPIQSTLLLASILIALLAFIKGGFTIKDIMANTFIHPITATIAGFLVAGALEASGGFKAAIHLFKNLSKTPLGLVGTVLLLVNIPTIFAMPCGRIWAAAIMPVAIIFGCEIFKLKQKPILIPLVVFPFIVNAAASCGSSLLGGIGMIAEGMGGFEPKTFYLPQRIAVMLISAVTMLSVKFIYRSSFPDKTLNVPVLSDEKPPVSGYISFLFFIFGLTLTFIIQPRVPIQTILLIMAIIIMIIGRIGFSELLAGIILHPVLAMISGFIIAGALIAAGSFEILIKWLSFLAEKTPLGYIGVAVFLVNLPAIIPMPCGRIVGVALLPGVLMFGKKLGAATGTEELAIKILLVAFIINAAASCGPSPIGGIGNIGESNLGVKAGSSTKSQQMGIMVGTGIAALIMFIFLKWS
jgi:hypothetical protein